MRLVNDTDEPLTIPPGETLELGFQGDYETERERGRGLSQRYTVIRVVDTDE